MGRGQHSRMQVGGGDAGPVLLSASHHPTPALVGAQKGKPSKLQPELVPPLRAKAGATKLVCQGAPVAPGSSPSLPPRRSSTSSLFPTLLGRGTSPLLSPSPRPRI